MRGIWLTLALVLSCTSALAKSHFLPDYQGAGLEYRAQETDKKISINTCSTYGLYNSIQSNMTCHVVYPTSGLTCYNCACDSAYKYSSADCPTSSYSLSEQCGGKYKTCSCNTTLYPTTSTTTGCPRGLISDTENYCEDKPDGIKHYACVRPVCKPDNITVEECQAKGDGHNCTASKETNCADYCDTNGCQDNCTYLKQTGQARSDCQYGCATGKDVSGCSDLCYECGEAPESPTNTCADIYDGKSNTTAIINQLGADALAATAANQYYVGDKNGDFGQGKWYLPSIGELVDMYGVAPDQITSGSGKTGATGGYIERINNVLEALIARGADAQIMQDTYLSSSENSADSVWTLTVSSANGSGNRIAYSKDFDYKVRPFLKIEKCFDLSDANQPRIGYLMFDNKTWKHVTGYYSKWKQNANLVGVIVSVGTDGSVKIISLKDLTFSSIDSSGNFDADNPYSGKYEKSIWAPFDTRDVNVVGVPNYSSDQLKTMLAKCATKEENKCYVDDSIMEAVFNGKSNTQRIVNRWGEHRYPAYITTQFYVGDKNGDFGQGKWYLPAVGEFLNMRNIDLSETSVSLPVDARDSKFYLIYNVIKSIYEKTGETGYPTIYYTVWSSTKSALGSSSVWCNAYSNINACGLAGTEDVVAFMILENYFNPINETAPEIGSVIYTDKTYGSVEDYDENKAIAGIIIDVSSNGSVKIMHHNFVGVNLFGASYSEWVNDDYITGYLRMGDLADLPDIDREKLVNAYRDCPTYEW